MTKFDAKEQARLRECMQKEAQNIKAMKLNITVIKTRRFWLYPGDGRPVCKLEAQQKNGKWVLENNVCATREEAESKRLQDCVEKDCMGKLEDVVRKRLEKIEKRISEVEGGCTRDEDLWFLRGERFALNWTLLDAGLEV